MKISAMVGNCKIDFELGIMGDIDIDKFTKYIEAYDPDKQVPTDQICGATSRLNHVCQKPKGHEGLHHNYIGGVTWAVIKEIPKVETVPCKNCDMSIEWNQGDKIWRHNHNKSLFCNVNKLDTVAQPNEPLDFGLTEDDKARVKENEALFVASIENTAEKTEFTKPLEAWAMPDGSVETRISNGSQTFVLNKINAEGKLEISDEFAEAIKVKIMPKVDVVEDSEMPIGEKLKISDVKAISNQLMIDEIKAYIDQFQILAPDLEEVENIINRFEGESNDKC